MTAIIIYFSLNPSYPLKQYIVNLPFGDPVIHLCSFGLLMYCFYQSWEHKINPLFLALTLVVLGIILEIQQAFVSGADFEFVDSLANTTGVIIAYLLTNFGNAQKIRSFSKD